MMTDDFFSERSVLLTKALVRKARALFFEAKAFTATAKTSGPNLASRPRHNSTGTHADSR